MSLINTQMGISISGYYQVSVIDSNKNVIWSQNDLEKNLILNNGMNLIGTTFFADLNKIAFAGTGSRANSISSGASSASVANGWLVLSPISTGIQNFTQFGYGGYVDSGSVSCGDVVKFSDGSIVNVTCSIGISNLSASIKENNLTIQTQSFVIWKTSQSSLEKLLKRAGTGIITSSYLTSIGGCGYSISGSSGSITYWRTYDFSTESISNKQYTEVGVGPSVNSLFSRIVLPNTVSVNVGENLRLKHLLLIQLPTTASIILNASMSGWPIFPSTNTNLTQSIQSIHNRTVSSIDSLGISFTDYACIDPVGADNNSTVIWASGNSQSLLPCGQYRDRSEYTNNVKDFSYNTSIPYINGSYERNQYALFDVDQVNGNIASFGLATYGMIYSTPISDPYSFGQALTVVLEQTQSKTNTQRLMIYFKHGWSRPLE